MQFTLHLDRRRPACLAQDVDAEFQNLYGSDGGEWKPVGDTFMWTPRARPRNGAKGPPPHVGGYRLEVKTVNQFGVDGPISMAEVEVEAEAKSMPRGLQHKPARKESRAAEFA